VKGERRGYRVHYFLNGEALIQARQQISTALPIREKKIDGKSADEEGE